MHACYLAKIYDRNYNFSIFHVLVECAQRIFACEALKLTRFYSIMGWVHGLNGSFETEYYSAGGILFFFAQWMVNKNYNCYRAYVFVCMCVCILELRKFTYVAMLSLLNSGFDFLVFQTVVLSLKSDNIHLKLCIYI